MESAPLALSPGLRVRAPVSDHVEVDGRGERHQPTLMQCHTLGLAQTKQAATSMGENAR